MPACRIAKLIDHRGTTAGTSSFVEHHGKSITAEEREGQGYKMHLARLLRKSFFADSLNMSFKFRSSGRHALQLRRSFFLLKRLGTDPHASYACFFLLKWLGTDLVLKR